MLIAPLANKIASDEYTTHDASLSPSSICVIAWRAKSDEREM